MTKPDYVLAWEWATGKEVFEHEGGWAYSKEERLLKDDWGVPGLTDAQWRADVEDGLLAKGHSVQYNKMPNGDIAAIIFAIDCDMSEPDVDAVESGPDIPSALCAAVMKAREAV